MLTVGLPRAMHYYKYYPAWRTLFENLGFKTVVSDVTNRDWLEAGSKRIISDTCIPIKAYVGHVCSLRDRCDLLFVPVLRSLETNAYNCARFLGLPDLVRLAVPEIKNVVDIDIDVKRGEKDLQKRLKQLSRDLRVDPERLKEAYNQSEQTQIRYWDLLRQYRITYQEGIDFLYNPEKVPQSSADSPRTTIGIIGHPYVVNDEYLNHNLIQRLKKERVRVLTPEMLAEESLKEGIRQISDQSYWSAESEVIGAAGSFLAMNVNGIIGITAFSCGPDSLMMSLVQHQAAQKGTPFLCLTIDEHSSETGLITRLEAFMEMLYRKQGKKDRCA